MHAVLENVIIFVTTTPKDIKPSTSYVHGRRHASVCKISPSYDAAFRRK